MPTLTAPCLWCGERLTFTAGRGWTHAEGGTYVMRCEQCGHTGAPYPSPACCPICGSVKGWRDDHCAQPGRA